MQNLDGVKEALRSCSSRAATIAADWIEQSEEPSLSRFLSEGYLIEALHQLDRAPPSERGEGFVRARLLLMQALEQGP
jgi:hypothetical protein